MQGFFIQEYPTQMVGDLFMYAEYIAEFVKLGHDVSVFTLNPNNLKTKEIFKEIEVHYPLIANTRYVFPIFVIKDLKNRRKNIRFLNMPPFTILSV